MRDEKTKAVSQANQHLKHNWGMSDYESGQSMKEKCWAMFPNFISREQSVIWNAH